MPDRLNIIPADLLLILNRAKHVCVLTGAGISAESGVPTFRQAQTGLWAQYNPQELATPEAFRQNPRLVWEWYGWRRRLVAEAQPNAGHLALVELETFFPVFTLITQNVDGLHRRAGSRHVVELHGNIQRTRCFDADHTVDHWEEGPSSPPACPHCGGLLRPDVVWFGESLPSEALAAAWQAAESCEIFFSIGTSALVQPAASLPLVARSAGATTVEINPDDTPLSAQMDFRLRGAAGQILPSLVAALQKKA